MSEINQIKKSGGYGVAGFILALISFPFMFIPIINTFAFVPWVLGLIFSSVGSGKNRENRKLSLAGLIISVVSFLVYLSMNFLFTASVAAS
jgi:hypothetical protein